MLNATAAALRHRLPSLRSRGAPALLRRNNGVTYAASSTGLVVEATSRSMASTTKPVLPSLRSRAAPALLRCNNGAIYATSTTTTRSMASTTKPVSAGLVPIVIESGAGGERSFDIFSRLLRERIICVHGQVDDHMASLVTAQLLFLEAENPTAPIYCYINSPGGVVTAGMAMYDTMQYIQPDVHTICMGQAASMGSLLLAGGAPGCRYALPNARIMLHQPSGGAQGMATDIDIMAKEILRTRANLNKLYVHHTGQSLEEIERVMDRDYFMDVNQAIEFGVIDKVLHKRSDADGGGEKQGDTKKE